MACLLSPPQQVTYCLFEAASKTSAVVSFSFLQVGSFKITDQWIDLKITHERHKKEKNVQRVYNLSLMPINKGGKNVTVKTK